MSKVEDEAVERREAKHKVLPKLKAVQRYLHKIDKLLHESEMLVFIPRVQRIEGDIANASLKTSRLRTELQEELDKGY